MYFRNVNFLERAKLFVFWVTLSPPRFVFFVTSVSDKDWQFVEQRQEK